MRGSRIFAGLVIILLIAIGLIYLENHGYFRNPRVDNLGLFKSDDTMPNPPSTPATTQATGQTPDQQLDATGMPPLHAAPSETRNEAVASANQAAMDMPSMPAASKTQYVDAQGNVCRPIQVPVPAPVQATGKPRHTRRPRQGEPMPDDWTYQPAATGSTPCAALHQTANGKRVVNLQSGMILNVALDQELGTNAGTTVGQQFTGYLIGPITYCGEVIVPAGAAVAGTIVKAHRHSLGQEDDSILQLRLTALDANGYRIPLAAYSYNRRQPDESHYKTTAYMDDPNFIETRQTGSRDVTLPAQSVVSFWLQGSAPVYF